MATMRPSNTGIKFAIKHHVPNSFATSAVAQGYEDQLPAMTAVAKTTVALAPPITSDSVIHDNACGPGVVTGEILSRFTNGEPPRIIATDIAEAMVAEAAKKGPSVEAHVMDAKELSGISDGIISHSFTNFLFVRGWDEADMVAFATEIRRTLKPGGSVVKAAWKTHEWHHVVKDALIRTRPGSEDQMPPQPWQEDMVREVFLKAGFDASHVQVTAAEYVPGIAIDWESEVWQQLLGAISSWVTRNMSEEEKTKYQENLNTRIEEDKKEPRMFKWEAWILTAIK